MLRFAPDSLLEGLLRPFLMIDPSGYLYLELMAPDWRPAFLVGFVLLGVATGRMRGRINAQQGRLLAGFCAMFYIWTFAIGNGRYFVAWLMVIGPLLVLASRWIPGTPSWRWVALGMVCVVQATALWLSYAADGWGLTKWVQAPGIDLENSDLAQRPAVFLTVSGLTYSILVPRFHAQSRWANIAGQRDIRPGLKEYPRLVSLLSSELPKYLVAPVIPENMDSDLQPNQHMKELLSDTLAVQGLVFAPGACRALKSKLVAAVPVESTQPQPFRGFWFCPVQRSADARATKAAVAAAAPQLADVFDAVEKRCPRFFPPGDGKDRYYEGVSSRHYPLSDVRLFIDGQGLVYFKYLRAMNPTVVGSVEQVRQGSFALPCDKLPGRYQLPWQRD